MRSFGNRASTEGKVILQLFFSHTFVAITNARVLLKSKQFDLIHGDLLVVLSCLRFVLGRPNTHVPK
jgi:hypothetical protein